MEQELLQRIEELEKRIDSLYSVAGFPDEIIKNLVKRGFVKYDFNLTTFTNASGLEFKSIFADIGQKKGLIAYTPSEFLIKFTASTSDTCTAPNHGLSDGQVVYVVSTGTFPSPLNNQTAYYIRDAATDTFKLTTSPGGAAVDITTTGAGDNYVLISG